LKAEAGLGNIRLTRGDHDLRNILTPLSIATVLVLAACASSGVDPGAAAHFKPGVTTRAEVIKRLGPPASVYDGSDETKTLSWAKDGGLFNAGDTKGLSIQFGPDDKMIKVVGQP
jgi:hypothetical protein